MLDILKVVILSLIEGITEFLPISSTGHLILANEFVNLQPESFANAFSVIIQLGAITSVVVYYRRKLNPFAKGKTKEARIRSIEIWKRVIVGFIPAGILGFLLDDIIEEYFFNPYVVAAMLLIWGIGIIIIEKNSISKENIKTIEKMSYGTAIKIGLFQCLAMIPGTSRSAASIIGAMLLGTDRKTAAEFSFFLAIPTMLGATLYKVLKMIITGVSLGFREISLILLGSILSFIVAIIVIKKFISYVQKNDFVVFGVYRILLSALVFVYFIFVK